MAKLKANNVKKTAAAKSGKKGGGGKEKPWGGNKLYKEKFVKVGITVAKKNRSSRAKNAAKGKKASKSVAIVPMKPRKAPPVVTYSADQSTLICGDGDFSFTAGLVAHRGNTGAGLVATGFDSKAEVSKKYPGAKERLEELKNSEITVLHGVDATKLKECLKQHPEASIPPLFDRIIFNFPHTGDQRVHLNRNLLRSFFVSAVHMIKSAPDGGQIHLTLKDGRPYTDWEPVQMAEAAGLKLIAHRRFDPNLFPGYSHQTTLAGAAAFDASGSSVFMFGRPRVPADTLPIQQEPKSDKQNSPTTHENGTVGGKKRSRNNDDVSPNSTDLSENSAEKSAKKRKNGLVEGDRQTKIRKNSEHLKAQNSEKSRTGKKSTEKTNHGVVNSGHTSNEQSIPSQVEGSKEVQKNISRIPESSLRRLMKVLEHREISRQLGVRDRKLPVYKRFGRYRKRGLW